MKKQVFLGGSCNPTTWRADISIPALVAANAGFYNPQIADWSEQNARYKSEGIAGGIAEVEAKAKADSQELLFVIDGQTRAIASMIEVTENVVAGRSIALVVTNIPDNTAIGGQVITGSELKDLNRARTYLLELAGRYPNAKVFPNVESATAHVIEALLK
jgi:raw